MKSYYCFVRDLGRMRPNSFVYHVAAGTSIREAAKLELVRQFCADCSLYFHRWSDKVDSALMLAAAPYRMSGNVFAQPFHHVTISINDLYKLIIDDAFEAFESSYVPPRHSLWRNLRNDPHYISSINHLKCNTLCQPRRRKNLSDGELHDVRVTAFSLCTIVALIILDGFISNIFHFV